MAKTHITMDFDKSLLQTVDAMAAERKQSREQFITESVERMLRKLERQRIDAAFERMADDAEYQAELKQVEKEMSSASEAAWRLLDVAEQCDEQSSKPSRRCDHAAR